MSERSDWQQKVEGVWHGLPSVFSPTGEHNGHIRVYRHLDFDAQQQPVFRVINEVASPCEITRAIADCPEITLYVADAGNSRVYTGPHIYGAGHPFGTTLLGNDYIHAWQTDTAVIVQLLPDGITQLYSCLTYQGPVLTGAILGRYRNVRDESPKSQAVLARFLQEERAEGNRPVADALRQPGCWTGSVAVYGSDNQGLGNADARFQQIPVDAGHTRLTLSLEGAMDVHAETCVNWHSQHQCAFAGPDFYGNAMAFGRALFSTRYLQGQAVKVVSRTTLLGDQLAVVWAWYEHGQLTRVIHGLLDWQEA